jgi:hypothetical protein
VARQEWGGKCWGDGRGVPSLPITESIKESAISRALVSGVARSTSSVSDMASYVMRSNVLAVSRPVISSDTGRRLFRDLPWETLMAKDKKRVMVEIEGAKRESLVLA